MIEETAEPLDELDGAAAEESAPQSLNDLRPKMQLVGTVKQLELYGAFIDIGVGTNAILHVSKLGKRVNRISDMLAIGDQVEVWVEKCDLERGQITVTMVEPLAVDWSDLKEGQEYQGKVTRLEKFGAFIDIGAEKEGLIHISELSHDYIKHPSETVKVGDEVQVKILGFNRRKRRIDLSRKALLDHPQAEIKEVEEFEFEDEDEEEETITAMEIALRRAMSSSANLENSEQGSSQKSKGRKRKKRQQEELLDRTLKLSQDMVD